MRQRLLGPRGNETELLHQQLPRSGRQRELINEDENVRQDQQDIDDREGAARRLATKRYHSGFTFYLKNALGRPRARKPHERTRVAILHPGRAVRGGRLPAAHFLFRSPGATRPALPPPAGLFPPPPTHTPKIPGVCRPAVAAKTAPT